ncbi:MAG: hypothetical protein LW860_04745 [Xanthomonadaceae bacterium]|jgi:hypothetical protein|nr:hypothetical protein [Xanthomonadaceae bacterium]
MRHTAGLTRTQDPPQPARSPVRGFPATLGAFEAAERAVVDRLADWVMDRYREDLTLRPSKHVYVDTLPADAAALVDHLRDSPVIREAIARRFAADAVITPMKHTDELYLSHYNKDFGGDHGLFARHYDGNLRFVPVGAVVRALIYLRSDASYTVVFGDSGVRKAFQTYDFGLLDFHRELHWVEGEYRPSGEPRILLKCNYLVSPPDAPLTRRLLLAANTGVFYVVKAAMEYSKSPRNPLQRAVGLLCNVARVLNNIHPLAPIALLGALLAAAAYGVVRALA